MLRLLLRRLTPINFMGYDGQCRMPEEDSLVELLVAAAKDRQWRVNARTAGPKHLAQRFTWTHVASELLRRAVLMHASLQVRT